MQRLCKLMHGYTFYLVSHHGESVVFRVSVVAGPQVDWDVVYSR